jgi:hypothetical protein
MKIDPEKIARMITEDPDEVAPSDHFDDFEDEYEDDSPADQEFDIIINFEITQLAAGEAVAWLEFPELQDPEDIQRKIIDDIEGLFRNARDLQQYHAQLTKIQSNNLPSLRTADHEY